MARDRAERHGHAFAVPVRRRCCVVPMAMFRPSMTRTAMTSKTMSSPTVPVRVVAAMAVAVARFLIGGGNDLGIGTFLRPGILATSIATVPRDIMAARHRAKYGQALIIGVSRLNFFTLVDAAGSSFQTSGGRDQGCGKNTVQDKSQDFIL